MDEVMNNYRCWRDTLDLYLTHRKKELNDRNENFWKKEEKIAYSTWAVSEILDRLTDITVERTAFDILTEFLDEMTFYRIAYGREKNDEKIELIFETACDVAMQILVRYC